jgi:hypothetical protein
MPDLGRHETEWAIESAWMDVLKTRVEGYKYTGSWRRNQEPPEVYMQVLCTEIESASAYVADKIEIATVEIRVASSKQYIEDATPTTGLIQSIKDRMIGAIRSVLFYETDLKSLLETGLQTRTISTDGEPLKIFHALYQTENISYYNIDDDHYHIRVARLQTVVGESE